MPAQLQALPVVDPRHQVELSSPRARSRAKFEQARGMLMMRYGISADDAGHLLRRWSVRNDIAPEGLAALLVDVAVDADPPGLREFQPHRD